MRLSFANLWISNLWISCIFHIFGYDMRAFQISTRRGIILLYEVTHAFQCLRDPVYIKAIKARLTTACFQRSRDCAISDRGFSDSMSSIFKHTAHTWDPRSSQRFLSAYLCLSAIANRREKPRIYVHICWSLARRLFATHTWNNWAAFIRSVTLYAANIFIDPASRSCNKEKKTSFLQTCVCVSKKVWL